MSPRPVTIPHLPIDLVIGYAVDGAGDLSSMLEQAEPRGLGIHRPGRAVGFVDLLETVEPSSFLEGGEGERARWVFGRNTPMDEMASTTGVRTISSWGLGLGHDEGVRDLKRGENRMGRVKVQC